jgi:2-polyprenyl-6-methoxyphenol hydroxylase-like FAD-dependent oxidoreductase
VLESGRRVETVAFYDGAARQAEVKLSELGGEFPFMVILPQNVLEDVLEQRLRKAGVQVMWGHRFDDLRTEAEGVVTTVEELGATGTGYIVPHWEAMVKRQLRVRSRFLVGADGHGSLVRERLGIENTAVARPVHFAVCEFEPERAGEGEVRVVLDQSTTNVLWPLAGNKGRWSFQVLQAQDLPDFPEKERRGARLAQKSVDDRMRQYVEKVAQERAPWFTSGVKEITWWTEVMFEQRLANQFGRDRGWLAGDAAHQTGPVGVQSFNMGLGEGMALAGALRKVLRDKAPLSVLEAVAQDWREEWRRLLGLSGAAKPGKTAGAWVQERCSRIVSCLPATHQDLTRLAGQLGLGF